MAHDTKSAGNGSATGSALHAIPATPRLDGVQQVRQLGDLMRSIFELGRVLQQVGIDLVDQGDAESELLALSCRTLAENVIFLSSVGIRVAEGHTDRPGADEALLPMSLHAPRDGQSTAGAAS